MLLTCKMGVAAAGNVGRVRCRARSTHAHVLSRFKRRETLRESVETRDKYSASQGLRGAQAHHACFTLSRKISRRSSELKSTVVPASANSDLRSSTLHVCIHV